MELVNEYVSIDGRVSVLLLDTDDHYVIEVLNMDAEKFNCESHKTTNLLDAYTIYGNMITKHDKKYY